MREIVPGIHAIEGLKTGRSYLVEDRDGLVLIDTSTGGVADKILAAIEEIGRKPEDLRLIVATHYHLDHTGNAATLAERTGAEFCVHRDDVPYVEGAKPWLPVGGALRPIADRFAPKQFSVKVNRILHDGEVLAFAGGLEVIHAPGHTPGHIALYARSHRTMFAGDALMNVLGIRLPLSMSSHDMDQAKSSVRRLVEFDFDHALPGHGQPILNRASAKIAAWSSKWI